MVILSTSLVFFFYKIYLFLFWFCVSIFFYKKILPINSPLKLQINNLTFLELNLVVFTLISFVMYLQVIISDFFFLSLDIYTLDTNSNFNCLGDSQTTSNPSTSSAATSTSTSTSNPSTSSNPNPSTPSAQQLDSVNNNSNINNSNGEGNNASKNDFATKATTKAVDGTIMAAAISAGIKLSQNAPTLASKIGVVAGGVALGASAIAAKNISGNLSENLGKSSKNLLSLNGEGVDLNEVVMKMFKFSGNDALDLLTLIQHFQKLQLMFIVLIIYNFILYFINLDRLENILLKILPVSMVKFYLKSINLVKKSSVIILICLLILLLISSLYAYHYLNIFIYNLDAIINVYFKK